MTDTKKIDFQHAYVLHARPYQESSLLLELLTPDYGRIGAIAKGAQRPKSKFRGLLQPFTPLVISCTGKGELLTLTEVDAESISHVLPASRLIIGFYVNELLLRLLKRWDPHEALFWHYKETLSQLGHVHCEQKTLRLFEKNLLKELGYGLPLTCVLGENRTIQAEAEYFFDPLQGPLLAETQGIKSYRLIKGSSLLSLAQEKLDNPRALLDAKRIMREALSIHLGSKPLESRRLLRI